MGSPILIVTLCSSLFLLVNASGTAGQAGCCFGRRQLDHGATALTLPSCCMALTCNNGNITPVHHGGLSGSGCCMFGDSMYGNGTLLKAHCGALMCVDGEWLLTGRIEDCCEHCALYNLGHVITFDNTHYHWSGPCNYSLAQTGSSLYPEIAVYSSFSPCYNSYCLQTSTFKNDNHTVITLYHVSGPAIFNMNVNGAAYTVPVSGIHSVTSGSNSHPVLVWRSGPCVYLLGSSQLLIHHCPYRIDVFAYPTHSANLYGLCGYFNHHPSDDMTARDLTVYPVDSDPLAFPESWRTLQQSNLQCQKPCTYCNKPTRGDECHASVEQRQAYYTICAQKIIPVLGIDVDLVYHIESCVRDLCALYQAGLSQQQVDQWLLLIVYLSAQSKIILARTLEDTVVPNPVFVDVPGLCLPGSSWTVECNRCGCSDDGSVARCTRRACSDGYVPELEDFCTNGSRWRVDECNVCVCIRGGMICSINDCSSTSTNTPTSSPTTIATPPSSTSPPFFVCALPKQTGSCTGYTTRWYYDYYAASCLPFVYTGCGGNSNNFVSKEQCLATCAFVASTTTTVAPTSTCPTLSILDCPQDCSVMYIRDPATNCLRCVCDPNTTNPFTTFPPPTSCVPLSLLDCPQGCSIAYVQDQASANCFKCVCDHTITPTVFSTPATTCPQVSILDCPQDCSIRYIRDPVTNCLQCVCDPGSSSVFTFFPTTPTTVCPPVSILDCPQDCSVRYIRDTVTNCLKCVCDPSSTGIPFPTTPATVCPPLSFLDCPQDCSVMYIFDHVSNCLKCVCDPNSTTNTFPSFPTAPVTSCPPVSFNDCPQDCSVMYIRDPITRCLKCVCDPNASTTPFSTSPPSVTCPTISILDCPQDCSLMYIRDPITNCLRCMCDPNSTPNPLSTSPATATCPPIQCPLNCYKIYWIDPQTGCPQCKCDITYRAEKPNAE